MRCPGCGFYIQGCTQGSARKLEKCKYYEIDKSIETIKLAVKCYIDDCISTDKKEITKTTKAWDVILRNIKE